MENLTQALTHLASPEETDLRARTCFQWGGTISAIFLLILNRARRRSPTQTSLLVAFLLSSLPTVFFKILRGQVGYWVAFLAVASHLFFPQSFPVSRFLLLVVAPSWVAHGLHDSIAGGIVCLVIGVLLLVVEIRGTGGFDNCVCNLHCFGYCLGMSFLFFFTILYLFKGPW